MTYVLAWTTADHAFIVADAAVTRAGSARVHETSFGEPPYVSAEKSVDESALKIYKTNIAILSGAGDADKIQEFARQYIFRSSYNNDPVNIFNSCAENFYRNPMGIDFSMIMGYNTHGLPKLYSFNRRKDGKIIQENDIVELGSGSNTFGGLGENCVVNSGKLSGDAATQISMVLGVFQSQSIRHYLLEQGVGGVFSGAYIGKNGSSWNPDILHALVSSDMIETSEDQTNFEHTVVTLFRRDVLIVASSFVGGVVAYMNGSEDDKRQDMIKRANDALDDAKHELSNFHFHTVCLISKSFILTVIVEMLKNNVTKHLGLRLKSVAADGLSRLSFGFSKELGDLLLGKSTHEVQPNVVFYECEPAIAKNWGKQP